MVEGRIPAGFPSRADDFLLKRQDLNELMITHPLATLFWQVTGCSMVGVGIGAGDILVVNRALQSSLATVFRDRPLKPFNASGGHN